ncbi:unnamed protein product [Gongylonema pulchrum]|uniref:Muscular LMNA interacting protein n=1 Tax=Gongylonema pulchrum TaxID=637853 RepID=A0A183D651_9BILA|nr:unnamed protein product [Gongylonema pulchrum]
MDLSIKNNKSRILWATRLSSVEEVGKSRLRIFIIYQLFCINQKFHTDGVYIFDDLDDLKEISGTAEGQSEKKPSPGTAHQSSPFPRASPDLKRNQVGFPAPIAQDSLMTVNKTGDLQPAGSLEKLKLEVDSIPIGPKVIGQHEIKISEKTSDKPDNEFVDFPFQYNPQAVVHPNKENLS